jgi:hypothetical protein
MVIAIEISGGEGEREKRGDSEISQGARGGLSVR